MKVKKIKIFEKVKYYSNQILIRKKGYFILVFAFVDGID